MRKILKSETVKRWGGRFCALALLIALTSTLPERTTAPVAQAATLTQEQYARTLRLLGEAQRAGEEAARRYERQQSI